ncbi:hypothetical protein [Bacillus sp. 03113]|uniref:DUF7210 family protein n=1 Tax=Bacillus sp. 03113 TaxID=2578211 RepID=UPI0015E8A2EF|nr:hypothetical protein [Bacillus sp. 03113]
MELKVLTNIKHNSKWYKPNEEIKKVKKEDGDRLIELGAAEEIIKPQVSPPAE